MEIDRRVFSIVCRNGGGDFCCDRVRWGTAGLGGIVSGLRFLKKSNCGSINYVIPLRSALNFRETNPRCNNFITMRGGDHHVRRDPVFFYCTTAGRLHTPCNGIAVYEGPGPASQLQPRSCALYHTKWFIVDSRPPH